MVFFFLTFMNVTFSLLTITVKTVIPRNKNTERNWNVCHKISGHIINLAGRLITKSMPSIVMVMHRKIWDYVEYEKLMTKDKHIHNKIQNKLPDTRMGTQSKCRWRNCRQNLLCKNEGKVNLKMILFVSSKKLCKR